METRKRREQVNGGAVGMLSYDIASHVLFDRMDYGNSLLFLYHNSGCHQQVFRNLVKHKISEGSQITYISHEKNTLNLGSDCVNYTFKRLDEEALKGIKTHLDARFNRLEMNQNGVLILADWGKTTTGDCSLVIPLLKELVQRYLTRSPGKRSSKGERQKSRMMLVNAFDITQVDAEFIEKAIGLHERVFLLQEGHHTLILPSVSSPEETVSPSFHVLPQQTLEKVLKGDLELITLLLLEQGDKSGFQLLKEIASVFHCILSQGTLYPLLYRLEKAGTIIKRNGRGKEVIYSLSPKTKLGLKVKKEHTLKAISHLAGFITASAPPPFRESKQELKRIISFFPRKKAYKCQ